MLISFDPWKKSYNLNFLSPPACKHPWLAPTASMSPDRKRHVLGSPAGSGRSARIDKPLISFVYLLYYGQSPSVYWLHHLNLITWIHWHVAAMGILYIDPQKSIHTLRENKTLPCDKLSHGKGAYMPGKVFAVRGRTATSARQRYRRQRGHCRALRVVCTATSLPCVLSFAVSPRVCRAAKRCRASTTLPRNPSRHKAPL
jgi:hypothetical protein